MVVVLVAVVLGVRWACAGGRDGASGTGANGGVKITEVKAAVGETISVGSAKVAVTVFTPTEHPTLPPDSLDSGVAAPAGAGETFYQAFVWIKNAGKEVVRADPRDFDLVVGDGYVSLDPARSGPSTRSLLPGASLNVIVTFRAPTGAEPELRWRPLGGGVTVRFTGQRKAAGMAALPDREIPGRPGRDVVRWWL